MIKQILGLTLISLLFSACISITKELPSLSIYSINIDEKKVDNKYFDKTIRVDEPKALSSVNSRDILYSQDKTSLNAYALSKYSDKPTKLIQQNLAKFLSTQNSYKLISTSNIKTNSDYIVQSEIVELKHQFIGDKSYAKFTIRVYLVDTRADNVFFKNFSYKKVLKKNDAKGFIDGLNDLVFLFAVDVNKLLQSSLK